MFVWVFHRISGAVLIFLMVLQLLTGFFHASTSKLEWLTAKAPYPACRTPGKVLLTGERVMDPFR